MSGRDVIQEATELLGTCTCREGRNQHGVWRLVDDSCPACGSSRGRAEALAAAGLLATPSAEVARDELVDQVMDAVDEVLRNQESASPMRWDCAHGAYGVAVAVVEKFQVAPR